MVRKATLIIIRSLFSSSNSTSCRRRETKTITRLGFRNLDNQHARSLRHGQRSRHSHKGWKKQMLICNHEVTIWVRNRVQDWQVQELNVLWWCQRHQLRLLLLLSLISLQRLHQVSIYSRWAVALSSRPSTRRSAWLRKNLRCCKDKTSLISSNTVIRSIRLRTIWFPQINQIKRK